MDSIKFGQLLRAIREPKLSLQESELRDNEYWTEDEDLYLMSKRKLDKWSWERLAADLRRSVRAIESRLYRLDRKVPDYRLATYGVKLYKNKRNTLDDPAYKESIKCLNVI